MMIFWMIFLISIIIFQIFNKCQEIFLIPYFNFIKILSSKFILYLVSKNIKPKK